MDIQKGNPTVDGYYVAYVKSVIRAGACDRCLFTWDKQSGQWFCGPRATSQAVLGWIGPLPAMTLPKAAPVVLDVDDLL